MPVGGLSPATPQALWALPLPPRPARIQQLAMKVAGGCLRKRGRPRRCWRGLLLCPPNVMRRCVKLGWTPACRRLRRCLGGVDAFRLCPYTMQQPQQHHGCLCGPYVHTLLGLCRMTSPLTMFSGPAPPRGQCFVSRLTCPLFPAAAQVILLALLLLVVGCITLLGAGRRESIRSAGQMELVVHNARIAAKGGAGSSSEVQLVGANPLLPPRAEGDAGTGGRQGAAGDVAASRDEAAVPAGKSGSASGRKVPATAATQPTEADAPAPKAAADEAASALPSAAAGTDAPTAQPTAKTASERSTTETAAAAAQARPAGAGPHAASARAQAAAAVPHSKASGSKPASNHQPSGAAAAGAGGDRTAQALRRLLQRRLGRG